MPTEDTFKRDICVGDCTKILLEDVLQNAVMEYSNDDGRHQLIEGVLPVTVPIVCQNCEFMAL